MFRKLKKTSCIFILVRSKVKDYVNQKLCDQDQPIKWLNWVKILLININFSVLV